MHDRISKRVGEIPGKGLNPVYPNLVDYINAFKNGKGLKVKYYWKEL